MFVFYLSLKFRQIACTFDVIRNKKFVGSAGLEPANHRANVLYQHFCLRATSWCFRQSTAVFQFRQFPTSIDLYLFFGYNI